MFALSYEAAVADSCLTMRTTKKKEECMKTDVCARSTIVNV